MNIRKLLDWRKVLIYSHRWLGIGVGIVFVLWCISGFVLMYYGIPTLKAGERLLRLPPLDLSAVRFTPAEAVRKLGLKDPVRLRISMQGSRPVYRINYGRGFGNWAVVYADTGEKMKAMDAEAAMEWMRRFRPDYASKLRYDAYLTTPDHFVRIPAMQVQLPFHRIALNDAAGTEYYVSEKTGEAVVKADRAGRVLGFTGYTLHRFFWWRQQSWYNSFLYWVSWIGIVMCTTGLVVGVWRFGMTARFRQRGKYSHSPYHGWMKWHHYAGLIFGLITFTWMISGAVDVPGIPGLTNVASPSQTDFSPAELRQGARSNQGTGAPIHLEPITIERIRQAAAAVGSAFVPKELELLEVGEKPYFIAYRAPASDSQVESWTIQSGLDSLSPNLDHEHVLVSATAPERGVFSRFDDVTMMHVAKAAMPGFAVKNAVWLDNYDDYYYYSVASFNVGLMKPVRTLPVLRVRFDDPKQTWLYMTPSHGQMTHVTAEGRAVRWSLYGLHALDFAFLYNHRPLWDIVVAALLIGSTVLSSTTLLPMYRRLKRHAVHVASWATRRARPSRAPQVAMARKR
jgi:hypothetical protein